MPLQSHNASAGGGESITLARDAMGTRFEVLIPPHPEGPTLPGLRAAAAEALDEVERLHRLLSPYDPASQVAAVNRGAGSGRPVQVAPELIDLFMLSYTMWDESSRAFDCTLGPLMRALGFRSQSGGPLDEVSIGTDRVRVQVDPPAFSLDAGMELDFGAIAKGYALDQASEILRAAGVRSALLHGGTSSVFALGAPPGLPGWRIALRLPGAPASSPLPVVTLRDLALGVSAPHGRLNERGEGHILDPVARASIPSGGFAACVSPSAARADAWSTAALVLAARGMNPGAATRLDVTTYLVRAVGMPPEILGPRPAVFEAPARPAGPHERTLP